MAEQLTFRKTVAATVLAVTKLSPTMGLKNVIWCSTHLFLHISYCYLLLVAGTRCVTPPCLAPESDDADCRLEWLKHIKGA